MALSERVAMEEYFIDDFIKDDWDEELELAISENRVSDDSDPIALVEGLMLGASGLFCRNPSCNGKPMRVLNRISRMGWSVRRQCSKKKSCCSVLPLIRRFCV